MKSKFWANVIAIVITVIMVFLVWLFCNKPTTMDEPTGMVFIIAMLALCNSTRDSLLRKED